MTITAPTRATGAPITEDVTFADLAIPAPDVHLGVGSGSHAHTRAHDTNAAR